MRWNDGDIRGEAGDDGSDRTGNLAQDKRQRLRGGVLTDAGNDHAWHALAAEDVCATLETGPGGLSPDSITERRQRYGRNLLPAPPRRNPLMRFLAQFNNTLIYVLLGGALAASLLDHAIDAAVIIAVVLANAVIGYIQEGRAERALESLKELVAPHASVLREDHRVTVEVADLVPGDIVLLEAGDRVPADLRLIETHRMLVDEALLTGESVTAGKDVAPLPADAPLADRHNMAFSGTLVAAGQATGVVVATGVATQIGRISTMIHAVTPMATPLLEQIDHFARRFTWFVLMGGVLLFAFAVAVRGYDWIDALIAVVAIAVGIVPEGLPAVITITLAIGVRRMAHRHAVIRKLPAVETLGATSVICTDKTGTLTRNEMTVRSVIAATGQWSITGAGYDPAAGEVRGTPAIAAAGAELLWCAQLCNDAELHQEDGEWRVEGDPMEGALLVLARKAGEHVDAVRSSWPRCDSIPFDAAHRFMATLHQDPDGGRVAYIKGAPETLFGMAAPGLDINRWTQRAADAASSGERVLAFGMKTFADDHGTLTFDDVRSGITFLGIIGFIDPPRDEVASAIAQAHSASIDVKMITGDHAATALAIARQLDLALDPRALTGVEIEAMDDATLAANVRDTAVFARTSPEHKLRIVRALQSHGLTVAMTGDGVNDAPPLKQADVGVAMGIKGTAAAKEAAEMVLLDDNFASIVSAVREGRTVYDNIRKVITWEIPTNGGETLTVVLAIILGFALPMTATQILWINLVLSITLGLVLAFEPSEPGVMQRAPRRRDAPLLSPFLLWRVVIVSILLAIATLGIFFYTLDQGRGLEVARTMVVNMFVVGEIFYLFNVRYLHLTSFSWTGVLGTPLVLLSIAVLVALQLLFTFAPFMNRVFGSRPLTLVDGMMIIAVGATLMIVLELEKLLMRRLGWFSELRD
jgi:calcium-translocating P-type ATPase